MIANDVKRFQQFLLSKVQVRTGMRPCPPGVTKNIGLLTKAALTEFQKSITPAIGDFGTITRPYVNSIVP